MVQVGCDGLCIGLSLVLEVLCVFGELVDCGLYVGCGSMSCSEVCVVLWLWCDVLVSGQFVQVLCLVLLYLVLFQYGMVIGVQCCLGCLCLCKCQVFGCMQCVWLYLEGNSYCVVCIGELVELINFFSWYLFKIFQSFYEESLQLLLVCLCLECVVDLLCDIDMMVGEVVVVSGFDNCCSFVWVFCVCYGQFVLCYCEVIVILLLELVKLLVVLCKKFVVM